MSISIGSQVRHKPTKITGIAAADETSPAGRRIRIDYQDPEKGDCQHWADEAEVEAVTEKAAPEPRS